MLQPLGFALVPIYIPTREALLGDVTFGKIIRVQIEFQVIEELDCNFLIGRDATRAYGIHFIESDGVIRIGDMVVPIADCPPRRVHQATLNNSVVLTEDTTVPAPSDVLLPISLSSHASIPSQQALLFSTGSFVDMPRDLYGRVPHTLMSSATSALIFPNLCSSPMRLPKGTVMGSIQVLAPNTRMTYFAFPVNAVVAHPPLPPSCHLHVVPDPDTVSAAPFGLSAEVSVDDRHVEQIHLQLDEDKRPGSDVDALTITVDKSLSSAMKDQLSAVIRKFVGCFAFSGRRLGKVDLPTMSVSVDDLSKLPSRSSPYRESPRTSKLISESMQVLKDLDIIEKGFGPVASPIVMVLQNGKYRFCVDFRGVNRITPMDCYPIPRPDAVFAALSGAQYFSTMDENKGYHQFALSPESRWLSAFSTEREGQWQYKHVPFGLQNATAFFQRSIDSLLGRWRWQFVLGYIDNVVVWSSSWDDHIDHLSKVLAAFLRVNLTLDERKCNFGFSSVDLLSLRVSRLGLRTLEQQTEAIHALPFPSNVKQLRQILGQFSYYQQFIPRFASVAEPLTSALKATDKSSLAGLHAKQRARQVGKQAVSPSPDRLAAFSQLKILLSSAPVL